MRAVARFLVPVLLVLNRVLLNLKVTVKRHACGHIGFTVNDASCAFVAMKFRNLRLASRSILLLAHAAYRDVTAWAESTRLDPISGLAVHRDHLLVTQTWGELNQYGAAPAANLVSLLR